MALASSTPIRLTAESDAALSALQRETKVNKSALLRLAITAGLPVVMEQFGVLRQSQDKPSARKTGNKEGRAA